MNLYKTLNTYPAGDMTVHYGVDAHEVPGMSITPTHLNEKIAVRRNDINSEQGIGPLHEVFKVDFPACTQSNLVQLKVVGDAHPGNFSGGSTMTNSASTKNLQFIKQGKENRDDGFAIVTELADARGLRAVHTVICRDNQPFLEVFTEVENGSVQPLTMEMLASFCLGGLSPFQRDDGSQKYKVHRFLSNWSAEGRHEARLVEELNLEKSWSGHGVRSLRFGQAGSQPVKGFFPFVALEDREHHVLWGAQIANPGSWQLEVFRQSDVLNLCGGLADREFGHWMKTLEPGDRFRTPSAILSCCEGDIQDMTGRMLRYQHLNDEMLPRSEQHLPVIFNDWCTIWGQQTDKLLAILADRLTGIGVDYLVVDGGWSEDQPGIQNGIGDWNISTVKFPDGFKGLMASLRQKGFVPGLWFELENCTAGSKLYEMTEHLLHRDGFVMQAGDRRFLDFRDPWVHEYLGEKVIRMLKENGITYLKTDYNDTIGLGCDGAESLGEGLRQHLEGVQRFYRRMREEIPELVIEICSSGGHRLEPSWMDLGSMGGFSDSHEGLDIPVIAANVQSMITARKNQIWAVLRKEDSIERIYYSMAAAFMGRMCLSGDVHDLDENQMTAVKDGIAMYHQVKGAIKNGLSRRCGSKQLSYTSPEGWQAVVRTAAGGAEAFAVIHTFKNSPGSILVPLNGSWKVIDCYKQDQIEVSVIDAALCVSGLADFNGFVVKLTNDELEKLT